jgi:hypothetical protein
MYKSNKTNLTNLKFLCFIVTILFLSNLCISKKIISSSKTSTRANTFELLGTLWQKVADENSLYTFPIQEKDYLVAYGYSNKWVIEKFQNTLNCSNSNFGEDPFHGIVKACYILKNFTQFTTCADEGEKCVINQTKVALVRYGYKNYNQYNYKIVYSSIYCSNFEFGDPAKGNYFKKCSYVYVD